jgi:hypothetical protein
MSGLDAILTLLLSQQFLLNCLATYAVIHVARTNIPGLVTLENRKWAKLGIDLLNLAVGMCTGIAIGYDAHVKVNIVIGLVASLFAYQVYNVVKRLLPERLGGESDDIIVRKEERRKRQQPVEHDRRQP